jgi:hypothetical protein
MRRRILSRVPTLAALGVAGVLFSAPVRAETAATLADVEAAYAEVDLDRTYSLALAALGAGGHDVKATARLYQLYAVAAAATDRADEAREAFLRVLTIDARGKLDRNLSPKIRAPYLEARGAWADASGGKSLAAAITREDGVPVLTLDGPLGAVSRVLVRVRRRSSEGFDELAFSPAARIDLPHSLRSGPFEYVVHLEDAAGNRLHELGSEAAPRRFGANVAESIAPSAQPATETADPAPYHVGAAVLATLGLGAVGAGAVFQLSREDAARKWNSARCEAPGATRGEQCASVDERRARAEQLSIVSYGGGGVLLAASVVTLLLAPWSRGERPASQSVACGAGFRAVSCSGRF